MNGKNLLSYTSYVTPNVASFVMSFRTALMLCLLIVSGCGGGGNGTPANAGEDNSGAEPSGALSGVVNLEQRYGKTFLDAWFVTASADAVEISSLSAESTDSCEVHTLARNSSRIEREQIVSGIYTGGATHRVADALSIDGRDGNYSTLSAMAMNASVTYSTEERWMDNPLPEDAVLSFSEAIDEWPFDSVVIQPMLALELVLPSDGVLENAAQAFEWEVDDAPNADQRIFAHIAITHEADESGSTEAGGNAEQQASSTSVAPRRTDIYCTLIDDGQFSLPQNVLDQLSESAKTNAAMLFISRQHTSVQRSGESALIVNQLSFPSL